MYAFIAGGVLVFVAGVIVVAARRRAARRAADAFERSRARRRRVPEVSANVRGLPTRKQDIWRDEAEASSRPGGVA